MTMTSNRSGGERRWEGYAVTNDEALAMLDSWRDAGGDRKRKLAGEMVTRLTYLVQSRIRRHRGQTFYDDLLQEGRMGLMNAFVKFNPERGKNFFKFAQWHIQTKIRRCLLKEIGRNEVLSQHKDSVVCARDESDSVVCARDEYDPSVVMEQAEGCGVLIKALDFLPHRDRNILYMRFGIQGGNPQTLQQIGDQFGLSRERVRQIESKALARLGRNSEVRRFFRD